MIIRCKSKKCEGFIEVPGAWFITCPRCNKNRISLKEIIEVANR